MGRTTKQYPRILTEADFTKTDHQMLTSASQWSEIAYYTIVAQQQMRAGYGDANHPENQGRVYLYLRTGEATPVEITGKWRLVAKNRARNWHEVIAEYDEELTHGDLNDKRKLIPLPVSAPTLSEDDVLAIEFKPAAAHVGSGAGADNIGWADATESLVKIPVTIRE